MCRSRTFTWRRPCPAARRDHPHAYHPVPRCRRHARRPRRGPPGVRHFPQAHWKKIRSTNPLKRLNGEIKRGTNVVLVSPNDATLARLVPAVVVENHDGWAVAERRYLSEESMAKIHDDPRSIRPTKRNRPWAITA
ncbi:transposase [Rhabdothermincola salaria]|uniref:transposase n=1 Tax=Rhabdothermincola salaria TaxID=2903142 RepID=UPI003D2B0644